jgi:hypothetical protein
MEERFAVGAFHFMSASLEEQKNRTEVPEKEGGPVVALKGYAAAHRKEGMVTLRKSGIVGWAVPTKYLLTFIFQNNPVRCKCSLRMSRKIVNAYPYLNNNPRCVAAIDDRFNP